MGDKTTILISEFKSCHQVAKLVAESSKQMQGLRNINIAFSALSRVTQTQESPDDSIVAVPELAPVQSFWYFHGVPGAPAALVSSGAALPTQLHRCQPSLALAAAQPLAC